MLAAGGSSQNFPDVKFWAGTSLSGFLHTRQPILNTHPFGSSLLSYIKHVRETEPAVHREIRMKTVRRKELIELNVNNLSSRSHYDADVASLYGDIRAVIADAEIFYRLYPTDGGAYRIGGAVIGLFKNGIEFHIAVRTYPKKCYTIYPDLSGLAHIDRYTVDRMSCGLEPPKKIGVLTRKKVEAWIDFHTLVYLRLKKENDKNRLAIETFKQAVEQDPDLVWDSNGEGYIERNGLRFNFEIRPTGVAQSISVCTDAHYGNYETFRQLADNRYEKQQPK